MLNIIVNINSELIIINKNKKTNRIIIFLIKILF